MYCYPYDDVFDSNEVEGAIRHPFWIDFSLENEKSIENQDVLEYITNIK